MNQPAPRKPAVESLNRTGRYLLYTLSIPERALRGTVGLAAGAAKEISESLVPRAFKDSKTYEIVIRNSLGFLTEGVAGIQRSGQSEVEAAPADGYVARKAVGNFLDLASLSTLHLSPVWLLAVVSDLAYGTRTYVKELATELAAKGLIDEQSTINSVHDVLEAVRDGSGRAASLFDTPPLTAADLKKTVDETRLALGSASLRSLLPAHEIQKFWNEMRAAATQEDASILEISGAMTLRTLDRVGAMTEGTFHGIRVAGGIVNRVFIDHYWESLVRIHDHGLFTTLRECYAPYVEGVFKNFSASTDTVTQQVLDGRIPSRFWGWLRRLFRRKGRGESTT
ncbi:MAG: hypothetical protein KDB53_04340 [Planctomycetes bacterium]|nr:hypothetical protein [Planctomycetota bacterium]